MCVLNLKHPYECFYLFHEFMFKTCIIVRVFRDCLFLKFKNFFKLSIISVLKTLHKLNGQRSSRRLIMKGKANFVLLYSSSQKNAQLAIRKLNNLEQDLAKDQILTEVSGKQNRPRLPCLQQIFQLNSTSSSITHSYLCSSQVKV